MMTDIIADFDIPKASNSIITVVGVGGGGGNAVNHMYNMGIHNVTFMVCNTDKQALFKSPIPVKVQLGKTLTEGLGAGNRPERGRDAAMESSDEIQDALTVNGTKMVFITAGMGGGTGTGAAPVIAKIARELGILTVAIVTMPFKAEGPKRLTQAIEGIEEIKKHVDSLLIIDNNNINRIYGDLTVSQAFGKADDILTIAAKGIAELITRTAYMNVDFADVQTVMTCSGVAVMGSAVATIGEADVAIEATKRALISPLLNQNDISGAKNILLNISWGDKEFTMDDTAKIMEFVQESAGYEANLITGMGKDESLKEDEVCITIIATGFDVNENKTILEKVEQRQLFTPIAKPVVKPAVAQPTVIVERFCVDDDKIAGQPEMAADNDLFEVKIKSENPSGEAPQASAFVIPPPAQEESAGKTSFNLYDDEADKLKKNVDEPSSDDFIIETRERGLTTQEMEEVMAENFMVSPEPKARKKTNMVGGAPKQHAFDLAGEDSITMSIEELEDLPAYQRRKIQIHNERIAAGKVSRLTLKDDN